MAPGGAMQLVTVQGALILVIIGEPASRCQGRAVVAAERGQKCKRALPKRVHDG